MMVAPSDSIGQPNPAKSTLLMRAPANTSNSSRAERERERERENEFYLVFSAILKYKI